MHRKYLHWIILFVLLVALQVICGGAHLQARAYWLELRVLLLQMQLAQRYRCRRGAGAMRQDSFVAHDGEDNQGGHNSVVCSTIVEKQMIVL